MKYILALILVSFSVSAQAQVSPEIANGPKINEIPEDVMIYTKNGKSVANFAGTPQSVIMNSLGYIRYAEHFIYGVEYSSFYGDESGYRMTDIQAVVGYRHLWNKRFLPYANFQFGHASIANEKNGALPHGDGISVTVDVGADLFKFWKIKTSGGVRNTWATFSTKDLPAASVTDLYFTVGFVF